MRRVLLLAPLLALATACATPARVPDARAAETARAPAPPRPGRTRPADVQRGLASFYHDGLAGRLTANGERYDPGAATCAHRKLPFGTVVEIRVEDTGARARCRINDRGPFVKGRIVDVSRSVARQLGLVRRGVAPVRLHVVSPPRS